MGQCAVSSHVGVAKLGQAEGGPGARSHIDCGLHSGISKLHQARCQMRAMHCGSVAARGTGSGGACTQSRREAGTHCRLRNAQQRPRHTRRTAAAAAAAAAGAGTAEDAPGCVLGIDLGTTNSAAAVRVAMYSTPVQGTWHSTFANAGMLLPCSCWKVASRCPSQTRRAP